MDVMAPIERRYGNDALGEIMREREALRTENERLRGMIPPPGWIIVRQADLDRLHNESEARRIERDAAREALNRIAHADWEVPNWRTMVDIARQALGDV